MNTPDTPTPLENELQELRPRNPGSEAQARMRSALQDARAEEQLAAFKPSPPSDLLRERIANALEAECAAGTAARSEVTPIATIATPIATPIATIATPTTTATTVASAAGSRSSFRIGFAIAAAAVAAVAAIALLWFGSANPVPTPDPTEVVNNPPVIVPAPEQQQRQEEQQLELAQAAQGKRFPLPFTPIAAERSVIGTEDGGIERIDGRPVRVIHVKLLDKVEYEQLGRRVIVERPVHQTVYNQLAYY